MFCMSKPPDRTVTLTAFEQGLIVDALLGRALQASDLGSDDMSNQLSALRLRLYAAGFAGLL